MNCSIIIRAYNEEKYIGRLLEGLKQQTLKEVEIILVDSGSTDQTISIAESCGARIVRIPSAEFTFWGAAKRRGNLSSLPARMYILCIPIGWRVC